MSRPTDARSPNDAINELIVKHGTIRDLADTFETSRQTVYHWIRTGKITPILAMKYALHNGEDLAYALMLAGREDIIEEML